MEFAVRVPPAAEDYPPHDGITDYVLTKTAKGNTWDQVKTRGIKDEAVTNDKIAATTITGDRIMDEAVGFNQLHASVRNPDATRLDDGLVVSTINGVYEATAPYRGSHTIHNASGTGLSITNSAQLDHRQNINGFSPTYDLDTDPNGSGIILVEANMRLNTKSNSTIYFRNDRDDATIYGFVFAGSVLSASNYAQGADNGVEIGFLEVHQAGVLLGTVYLYLGHDSNNVMGYWLTYQGAVSGFNWAFSMTPLKVASIASD